MEMNYERMYYTVSPQIVKSDSVSEIRIVPRFGHGHFPEKIKVELFPVDGLYENGKSVSWFSRPENGTLKNFRREGESLVITGVFPGEQEHGIKITLVEANYSLCFFVQSLEPDLFALRPFRGDFHTHTTASDGREDALYTAARFRQMGFDFFAVTDHRKYTPSVRTEEYWKNLSIGFRIWHGEEVHLPDNPVHIVNFNGNFSVNERAYSNEDRYRREVREIAETLTEVKEENREIAASCEWAFDRIREGGGIAMFCHPFWQWEHGAYVISASLTEDLFKRGKFDIFETLSGNRRREWHQNNRQKARYFAEQAKSARPLACVGISDSHGVDVSEKAGWFSTAVLARSSDFQDIAAALRAGNSCAVSTVGNDQPDVVGNFRLVRYVTFLMREYFPVTTRICEQEGALMLEALAGNTESRAILERRSSETEKFRKIFFGDISFEPHC